MLSPFLVQNSRWKFLSIKFAAGNNAEALDSLDTFLKYFFVSIIDLVAISMLSTSGI